MSEISETEIKSMTKEQNYMRGYEDGKSDVIDKIRAEIKEWYWQVDKQALAKDPCVVDAMVDLFVRTINEYKAESEGQYDNTRI